MTTRSGPTLPRLDGRLVAAVAVVLAIAMWTVGSSSLATFAVISVAIVGLTGYAAYHWPLPTLVVAVLTTFADGEVTPRLLPPGLELGPIGLAEPLLLASGLVIAAGAVRRGAFWPAVRDPVVGMAAAFVGIAVASALINAVSPVVALLGIFVTIDALAVYVVARMIPMDVTSGGRAVGIVIAAIMVVAVIGLAQIVIAPVILGFPAMRGQFGEGFRITAFLGSPNMVAAVIGIAIGFVVLAARHLPDPRWRWLARAGLVVLLLALLFTYSRGGWLAIGTGAVAGMLLIDWRSFGWLVVAGAVAWGSMQVLPQGIVSSEIPPEYYRSMPASPTPTPVPSQGQDSGSAGSIIDSTIERLKSLLSANDTRGRYLRDGLRILVDRPVLGVGPGRYGGAVAAVTDSPIHDEYDVELFGYRTVHNFWLHLLGETGALGFAAYAALLILLCRRLIAAARRSDGVRLVIVGGAATMLIVVSAHSLTEMILEGNMPALTVWLLLGIASVLVPAVTEPRPVATEA